jgi:hypothetical protein
MTEMASFEKSGELAVSGLTLWSNAEHSEPGPIHLQDETDVTEVFAACSVWALYF